MAGRKGEKHWADAVRIAVNAKDGEGRRKLRAIAEKTVEMALDGDMAAIKEIGDRLDGKAHQSTDNTTTLDITVTHEKEAADEFARVVSDIAARSGAGRGAGKPH